MRNGLRKKNSYMVLAILSLVMGVCGMLFFASHERFLGVGNQYSNLICQSVGMELEQTLVQIESETKSLMRSTRGLIESVDYLSNPEGVDNVVKNMKPLIQYTMGELGAVDSLYLRFDPVLTDPLAGLYANRIDGEVVFNPTTDLTAYPEEDISNVGWYYLPARFGNPMWIEPYYNANLEQKVISYVVPIWVEDKIIGVIGADVKLSTITDAIWNNYDTGNINAYLLGQRGELLSGYMPANTQNLITKTYKLRNNMELCMTMDKKILQPVRHSKGVAIFFFSEIALLLIMCWRIWYENHQHNDNRKKTAYAILKSQETTDETRDYQYAIRAMSLGLVLLVVAQIVFGLLSGGLFDRQLGSLISGGKVLRVTGDQDFAPYSYVDEEGNPKGSDVAMIYAIAREIGYKVELNLQNWNDAVEGVKKGDYDILLSIDDITDTEEPDLIASTTTAKDSFVIYGKNQISGIMELKDKRIGTIYGIEEIDSYGLGSNAVVFDSYEEELWALERGECDYAILRRVIGETYREKYPQFAAFKQVYDLADSKLSIGLQAKNALLLEQINGALEDLEQEGKLERIERRWHHNYSMPQRILFFVQGHLDYYLATAITFVILILGIFWTMYSRRKQFLLEESQRDALTGIYNRGTGEEKVREMMDEFRPGMFCLFDVDKFKRINDTYGHAVGDQVLQAIATCVEGCFRVKDVVFRLGGDEFAIYASGVTDYAEGEHILQRVLEEIRALRVPSIPEEEISISVGAAFYDGESAADFETIYGLADRGAYMSKKTPGSCYTFVDKDAQTKE